MRNVRKRVSMIQPIVDTIHRVLHERGAPILVAIDGRSGSGKSTIAAALAGAMSVTVVPTDDFFAAEITAAEWDTRSAAERARDAIDWYRLRLEALEPLLAGQAAAWHPFDFVGGVRADDTYARSLDVVRREPAAVIVLDGAYSTRPELAEVIDLTVLVEAFHTIRVARLRAREDPAFLAAWHERWDAAEDFYFAQVRPPEAFDMVINDYRDPRR
jgi:uridine kinase